MSSTKHHAKIEARRVRRPRRLRTLGIGAALAMVLAMAALASLLIPAHRQIRSIQPDLPSIEELRELLLTEGGPSSVRGYKIAEQAFDGGRFSHNSIALEWPDGRIFLVDLAMDEEGAADFAATLERLMGAEPGVFHENIGTQLGDAALRVEGVGFTHLHIDHVQGVDRFCNQRGPGATAFSTLEQSEQHNFNTREGFVLLVTSCLETTVLEGQGILPVPGFPGLAMVPLGGHTPGSTLFAAAVGDRIWLFSGDTTNSKADLLADRGKGWLYSGFIVPEDTRRTAELRAWLRSLDALPDMTVVVSHDLEAAQAEGLPSS